MLSERVLKGRKSHCFWTLFFLASSSGLHETLALLTSQLRPDSNHREEMGFLRDVFSEKSLSYLMKVRAPSAPLPSPREALPCVIPATSLPP